MIDVSPCCALAVRIPADSLRCTTMTVGQVVVTIDVLPDDVLLAIFDFYVFRHEELDRVGPVFDSNDARRRTESWQSLVHVCRR
jgi:hypothetical protein